MTKSVSAGLDGSHSVSAGMDGSQSISAASQLFCVPFSTLQRKAVEEKSVSAGLNSHLRDASGHPRVFNSDQEIVFGKSASAFVRGWLASNC
jgi:hypothetical protein